jgi:hypothetical protein
MPRRGHTPEQVIRKLREAEVELARGQRTGEVVRKLGIIEQTYYTAGARSTAAFGWTRRSA